ncbi:WGR domain-containing protein [Sinosporangium siamense]|uniref:Molybdenum metabolism regulator n=1 Tax=Sinosporangium siamense TaxID=1367973 RepID=A0A919VG19_9ACTN|nr:WGR domain-containing protein [Sinosporangium siamense]GII96649.1 molybdenum metabolism regulator [Sinosporangium siamense]
MIEQTTYLELSEEGDGAHKFYEVVQAGTQVTISYGRIGDRGQVKVSSFATEEKATTAAAKKVAEKVRKGYAPAVRGVRTRRSVTRRAVVSHSSTASQAPVLWRFNTGDAAFGIYIDDQRCWVGNQAGDVYTLTHDGSVTSRFRLPDGVKCLVGDDFWIYAGADDGKVYDLSGKVPRVAYEIAEDVDIYWLDIRDGVLGVSDAGGRVTVIDHEDEFQWERKGSGMSGWMVRCDDKSVYHGHSEAVSRFETSNGEQTWRTPLRGQVLFGWQESDDVYAGCSDNKIYRLAKADGKVTATYKTNGMVFSCATAPGGRYVFAGDNHSSIYCFDEAGTRLWKLATGCGSALSMQFLDDRLYIVTTGGALACIDASEAAILAAQQGDVPVPVDVKAAATLETVEPTTTLATTAQAGDGVVVECIREGSGLRVRVVSPGYESSWNVQFPKDIREAGARYVIDGVRTSGRGGFYRAYGDIRRLI